jgi:membrane protein YdbS with pleckstrin-like domain
LDNLKMKDPIREAAQAETWQSVKALLIPLSLFVACLLSAAGTFLVYNGESAGWMFLAVAAVVIVLAFVGLIRFQNSYRVKGVLFNKPPKEVSAIDMDAKHSSQDTVASGSHRD